MWKRYLSATPANVARLLLGVKTILVTLATAEFMSGNSKLSFYILLATGILNEAANFLTAKNNDKDSNNNSTGE